MSAKFCDVKQRIIKPSIKGIDFFVLFIMQVTSANSAMFRVYEVKIEASKI